MDPADVVALAVVADQDVIGTAEAGAQQGGVGGHSQPGRVSQIGQRFHDRRGEQGGLAGEDPSDPGQTQPVGDASLGRPEQVAPAPTGPHLIGHGLLPSAQAGREAVPAALAQRWREAVADARHAAEGRRPGIERQANLGRLADLHPRRGDATIDVDPAATRNQEQQAGQRQQCKEQSRPPQVALTDERRQHAPGDPGRDQRPAASGQPVRASHRRPVGTGTPRTAACTSSWALWPPR